jgi:Domain of unknown function (DUF1918)
MSMESAHRVHGKRGDRLMVPGRHVGEPVQDAEILEAVGDDGGPPYVIQPDDGRAGRFYPSSDVDAQRAEDG